MTSSKEYLQAHLNLSIYMLDQAIIWHNILQRWRASPPIQIIEYLKALLFFRESKLDNWVLSYLNMDLLAEAATGHNFGTIPVDSIVMHFPALKIPHDYQPDPSLKLTFPPEIVNAHLHLEACEHCTREAIKSLNQWLQILQEWLKQQGKIDRAEFLDHFTTLAHSYALELIDFPHEIYDMALREVEPTISNKMFNEITKDLFVKPAMYLYHEKTGKLELEGGEWDTEDGVWYV